MNDFEKNIKELIDLTNKNNVKLIAVTKTVPVEIINDAIKSVTLSRFYCII